MELLYFLWFPRALFLRGRFTLLYNNRKLYKNRFSTGWYHLLLLYQVVVLLLLITVKTKFPDVCTKYWSPKWLFSYDYFLWFRVFISSITSSRHYNDKQLWSYSLLNCRIRIIIVVIKCKLIMFFLIFFKSKMLFSFVISTEPLVPRLRGWHGWCFFVLIFTSFMACFSTKFIALWNKGWIWQKT